MTVVTAVWVKGAVGKAITGLKQQVKRADRVSVYLDGEYGFGLHRSVAASLQVGQQLRPPEIEQLKRLDRIETAVQRAARLVAGRPRSEHELELRLKRQGYEPDEVEQAIERLRSGGLVDDLEFARAWVENRMDFRPRGTIALRSELRRKGVAREVIDQALEDFDEAEAARRAAVAGARKYQHLSPDDYRRRLSAYLSRRGFNYQTISPLLRELVSEMEQESEEPN